MTTHQEVPIDFVVCFFEVNFQNNANLFFNMHMMHDFMQGENPIHQEPILNESIVLHTEQLGSIGV
jgi:hypothetical protein